MKMNSYEKNLHDNVASLLTKAYDRVATIEKAVKGFQSTGIFPFDKNIFPDEDFALPNEVMRMLPFLAMLLHHKKYTDPLHQVFNSNHQICIIKGEH
jgi:hypothetical protein